MRTAVAMKVHQAEKTPEQQKLVDAIRVSLSNLKREFEIERKSEVVKNITSNGFDNFASSSTIKVMDGVDIKNFDKVSTVFLKRLQVNEATRAEIKKYFDEVPNQKVEEWNMFRTIYSVD